MVLFWRFGGDFFDFCVHLRKKSRLQTFFDSFGLIFGGVWERFGEGFGRGLEPLDDSWATFLVSFFGAFIWNALQKGSWRLLPGFDFGSILKGLGAGLGEFGRHLGEFGKVFEKV